MSNIQLVIEEREAKIGNFLVGRLLPFRKKRTVGPFAFIDHMGPADLPPGQGLDIGPHPHIGLSTLTFLFEGRIKHRDTTGAEMIITPGAVNWMTAGQGVVHSERTPQEVVLQESRLHGLQIWVALPKIYEDIEPSFQHIEASDIPQWQQGLISYRLVAGQLLGRQSPVKVYSPLYMLEIKAQEDDIIDLSPHLYGESALYILNGAIESDGHTYSEKNILIAEDSTLCSFKIKAGSTIYIFGGEPFPEERFIFWNFVSSDKEKIEKAKINWQNQVFPDIPGEDDRVPLPQ